MKYINGLDTERADATCPANEKVLWTCLRGFPKINVVTLYTSKDSCIRLYTESGGIMDIPFSGYVRRNCGRSDADRETEMLEEIVNRDAVIAELRECLTEALHHFCCHDRSMPCTKCWMSDVCEQKKWRKALEGSKMVTGRSQC